MTQAGDPIGVAMIGYGTVGQGVARLLRDQAELYAGRLGRPIQLRRVLVRDAKKAEQAGVDPGLVCTDADEFFQTGDVSIVIEVAGGLGAIDGYVRRALEAGKHVVTANKALLAAHGHDLFALAREHGVSIAMEASCGGGIPCITALTHGLMANDIRGLYGILNGTCNFILSQMTGHGATYDDALAEAQELGYAEADPTLDVSGQDAAQKLAILASLAFGVDVRGEDVPASGVAGLSVADIGFAAELGYDIKLLAIAERGEAAGGEAADEGGAVSLGVEPCFIGKGHILTQVHGAFNALAVVGHAVGHTLYYGQGAGQMPTASAVVGDLLGVASGGHPAAFAGMRLTPDLHQPPRRLKAHDVVSRFFLRLHALDEPGVIAEVTRILGDGNISLSAMLQHESKLPDHVPVVITTHAARRGDVLAAAERIGQLKAVRDTPAVIRIVDLAE